jgi:prevent-host-death family protein
MDKIIPISDLQTSAKRYVDQVRKTDQPIIVTQRGRPAAVLVSYAEFEGLLETKAEMQFGDWRQRLDRAENEIRATSGISLEAYLKKRNR